MNMLRLGIIGLGNMGAVHVRAIQEGKVPGLTVTAVCDSNPKLLPDDPAIACFTDAGELFHSGKVDAVLVSTPHYSHTSLGVAALAAGLHVLVEKPISVHKADCERLLAAYAGTRGKTRCSRRCSTSAPIHFTRRSARLLQNGELGELRRVNWIITNWFRPEAYYASGGWRGHLGGVKAAACCSTSARTTST